MKPCVIFDLDGTLADTSGDLIAAANRCLEAMGHAERLCPQRDAGLSLRGARAMLTEGLTRAGAFDPALVEAWFPRFIKVYDADIAVHTRLYPGAVRAIEALRGAGYAVGVFTNKPEAQAEKLLRLLGITRLFGAMRGADTVATGKPGVAPYWAAVEGCGGRRAASLLVGDSATDRETARAAGVPSVLVTFAPPGEAVRALAPDAVIDHFDDLMGEVRRLIAAPGAL